MQNNWSEMLPGVSHTTQNASWLADELQQDKMLSMKIKSHTNKTKYANEA